MAVQTFNSIMDFVFSSYLMQNYNYGLAWAKESWPLFRYIATLSIPTVKINGIVCYILIILVIFTGIIFYMYLTMWEAQTKLSEMFQLLWNALNCF